MGDGQLRNDDKMFDFESSGNDMFPERSEIVFVSSSNLLNQSMQAEAFELTRDLS